MTDPASILSSNRALLEAAGRLEDVQLQGAALQLVERVVEVLSRRQTLEADKAAAYIASAGETETGLEDEFAALGRELETASTAVSDLYHRIKTTLARESHARSVAAHDRVKTARDAAIEAAVAVESAIAALSLVVEPLAAAVTAWSMARTSSTGKQLGDVAETRQEVVRQVRRACPSMGEVDARFPGLVASLTERVMLGTAMHARQHGLPTDYAFPAPAEAAPFRYPSVQTVVHTLPHDGGTVRTYQGPAGQPCTADGQPL